MQHFTTMAEMKDKIEDLGLLNGLTNASLTSEAKIFQMFDNFRSEFERHVNQSDLDLAKVC